MTGQPIEYHPQKETVEVMLHNMMVCQQSIQEKIKNLEGALKVTNMRIADLENELNPRDLGEVAEKNWRK